MPCAPISTLSRRACAVAEAVLELDNVGVVLGTTRILDKIGFTVASGESVALIGQNGSGKSTLMRTLASILEPAEGTIRIFGRDLRTERSAALARLGYVPQRFARASGVPATALEVVRTGLLGPGRLFAHRGRAAREASLAALDTVGLADRARDHVQTFSGGQMQRVMIARALVRRPRLLLLDEPLAGIDRASREQLAGTLAALRADGVTMMTVLHEMGELAGIVERTIELAGGALVYDGPSRESDACLHAHDHHEDTDPARPAHHAPEMIRRNR